MALRAHPNGFGTTGYDPITTAKPAFTTGDVWYVNSATGSDAASPRGLTRNRPLATLSQALTNAANDDMIVLMAGHSETITVGITISERLLIVGEGSGTTRPKFTRNADIILFTFTAARISLRNLLFPISGTSTANALISGGTQTNGSILGCSFECGANDTGAAVSLGLAANDWRINGCEFTSKATAAASQPESAIKVTAAVSNLEINNLTVDGGTYGWSNQYPVDLSAAAITNLLMENLNLKTDADVGINSSSTYRVTLAAASVGSRIREV